MNLLDLYKSKQTIGAWFKRHASLGMGAVGRMFEYTNTNFRTQKAFINAFKEFREVWGLPREQWPLQQSHGQEKHKHYVVNMLQSKLFRKDVADLYHGTRKGHLYGDFIEGNFSEAEQWLINYLFLLNGYYANRKNYIIRRVKEDLLGNLLIVEGINEGRLVNWAKQLLATESFSKALRCPFFYVHSLYDDSDFLTVYFRSSEEEREELAQYIENNRQKRPFACCISKKYQQGGNFNHGMLLDETKVFLLTLSFISTRHLNAEVLPEFFTGKYAAGIDEIEKDKVKGYLEQHKNIFNPIFSEILGLEEIETEIFDTAGTEEPVGTEAADQPEEYIDETSDEGKQKIKEIYSRLKRQAKKQSGHTCALEAVNNCKPIYFTAKKSGENYVELHHLIPREFRNDFPHSIEVLANYVTLCPRCHRQIHLATDRERKHLINALYADRKDRLEVVGLGLELKDMYSYYKVDN